MATELEFVNYKEFVAGLSETESLASTDKVVVSNPTDGPRSVPGSAKDFSTIATEADLVAGNYITIAGSAGTKKLPGDFIAACNIIDRGRATVATINSLSFKQNGWKYEVVDDGSVNSSTLPVKAGDTIVWKSSISKWVKLDQYVRASLAPYSVSFDSVSLDSSMFHQGNITSNGSINVTTTVMYSDAIDLDGANYVKASVFVNYRTSVAFYNGETFVSRTDFAAIGQILEAFVPENATSFRVQFWKANGAGDAVYADAGLETWLGEKVAKNLADEGKVSALEELKEEVLPYSIDYTAETLSSSMFVKGNINSEGVVNTSSAVMYSSLISLNGANYVKASVLDNYRVCVAFYSDLGFISRTDYAVNGQTLEASVPENATSFRVQFWKSSGGGDAVYADSGVQAWTGEKVFKEVASLERVDGIEKSFEDLFPYDVDYSEVNLVESMFHQGNITATGNIDVTTSVMYSDAIPAGIADFIKASVLVDYRQSVAFYGDGDQFISRTDYAVNGQTLEASVPENATSFRVQFWKSSGGGEAVYADSGIQAWSGEKVLKDSASKESVDALNDLAEDYGGDTAVKFSQGSVYSATGYDSQYNSSWYTKSIRSNFIRCQGLFVIGVKSGIGLEGSAFLYDKDKNFISSSPYFNESQYLRHDGYVRLVIIRTDRADFTPSDVSPDEVVIPRFHKNVLEQSMDTELFMPVYKFTSESAIAYLDKLAADHSNYITDYGLLTMDSSGEKKINYYKLGNGAKKLAIVSGQHGPVSDPFDSVITLCALIRSLCNNEFSQNDFLWKLKTEYTIYVIPILNPYGIDNYNATFDGPGGRNNVNGVNLNRDWTDQTQVETQKAAEALTDFAPDVVIDLHATGNYPGAGDFGYQWGWLSSKTTAQAYNAIIGPAHLRDYDIVSRMGYSEDDSTLQGKALDSWAYLNLGCVGCTCECQYMIAAIPTELHTSQVESANFSWLANTILATALAAGIEDSYDYILTPPQKGC